MYTTAISIFNDIRSKKFHRHKINWALQNNLICKMYFQNILKYNGNIMCNIINRNVVIQQKLINNVN